jgi:Ca2+-binding RTX toxin-like protein
MLGHAGDDRLAGGRGNDYLNGGLGADTLRGDAGDDRLYGMQGNDTLSGGYGRDVLYGGSGDDRLYGGTGRDVLNGQAGADRLYAQQGDDCLDGGAGHDDLRGGDGNDRLIYDANDTHIRGDAGEDTLVINGAGVTLDLRNLNGLDLRSIEVVDLNGSGANTLMLDARDVLHLADHGVLRVMGGADDFVNSPSDAWTRNDAGAVDIDGQHYNRWDAGGASLLIDADVGLNNVAANGESFVAIQGGTNLFRNAGQLGMSESFTSDSAIGPHAPFVVARAVVFAAGPFAGEMARDPEHVLNWENFDIAPADVANAIPGYSTPVDASTCAVTALDPIVAV